MLSLQCGMHYVRWIFNKKIIFCILLINIETFILEEEDSCPESPESHETVLAQPYRVFSPVRDAATNTTAQNVGHLNKKVLQQNLNIGEEIPIKDNFRHNPTNFYNEIPFYLHYYV